MGITFQEKKDAFFYANTIQIFHAEIIQTASVVHLQMSLTHKQ